ncbi:MAG: hypothetical protein JWO02_986 [Solirubrobacterales bacterium]|nr:hypothetical protein [Solirubrobacterales bacterium]
MMGLLDDAIREHLELKRLHGADASEVARQEHEALGPVRREDIAIPGPGAAVAPEPEPEPIAYEQPPAFEEPAPVPPAAAAGPDAGQSTVAFSLDDLHAAEPAPSGEPTQAQPSVEPVAEASSPATEPVPEADPGSAAPVPTQELSWDAPPPAPPSPAEPETVAPDIVPADEEPGEHDELEETPEFLQETPEHDRLWFEQKPPRDFDF